MREQDQVHDLTIAQMLAPVSVGANTNTSAVDMLGYSALTMVVEVGVTTLVATMKVQDSDDGITFADVADAALIGATEANLTLAADDDGKVARIGYIGGKRYARLAIARSAGSGILSVIGIQGCPRHAPTPEQHFA